MTDYRTMLDKTHLGAWDLKGKAHIVTIARVERGEVHNPSNNKKKGRNLLFFEGKSKSLIVNSTIGKAIAGMYGVHVEEWKGKKVTIFPTTTKSSEGEVVDCIRVKPTIPTGAATNEPLDEPVDEAMRAKQQAAAEKHEENKS